MGLALTFDDFVALDNGVAIGPCAEGIEVDDILDIPHPEVLEDDDAYIVDHKHVDELNPPVPSLDTCLLLDTALKFSRTLSCSEKQYQSVRELKDLLAEHQLDRLQQYSITSFF